MRKTLAALAAFCALLVAPAAAQPPAWNPQPWLEDLAQMRAAIETKYANLDYLLTEREFDLAGLFERAGAALRQARSDADAIAVFNRIVQRIADGHVGIDWPRPSVPAAIAAVPAAAPTAQSFCRALGFDPSPVGIGPALSGFAPVASGDLVPAGTVRVGTLRAGVLRIAKFEPGSAPSLCAQAVAAHAIPLDRPCDAACRDIVYTAAYARLTAAVEERLRALRAAGADILVVDVTGNGGGSEWVQAVARMLSPREIVAQPMGFVRGPHWAGTWSRLAARLRGFAEAATPQDRSRLLAWAAQADAARAEAGRTCPPRGDPSCPWLGRAGFATGLVASLPAGAFAGKEWGPWVFNPAQYPYHDGVWDGPVVVLVDEHTASAAEEFAALLQDNRVAIVVGGRTAGLGCGHTWGGSPTRLANSGAILNLPDCARFRADGSNEVRGVIPDLLLPWRAIDGPSFRARMLEAALPEAARRARALHRGRRSE
ncbi:MAG TPA: S41 family peptidase [Allosphingosinicella sp.]|jgi:hypothetical protein